MRFDKAQSYSQRDLYEGIFLIAYWYDYCLWQEVILMKLQNTGGKYSYCL
jgi:hypothetical protein